MWNNFQINILQLMNVGQFLATPLPYQSHDICVLLLGYGDCHVHGVELELQPNHVLGLGGELVNSFFHPQMCEGSLQLSEMALGL